MTTSIQGQDETTRWDAFVWRLVDRLDPVARELAWRASAACAISDAGVFFDPQGYSWFGVLKEGSPEGGGSFTLHLGRSELVVDYRAASPGRKRAPLPHWSEHP